MDPDKIQAIQQWPIPSSIRQLRGFLGLTRYYRRFIPHYACLTAPLTYLLRKDAFVWSDATAQAFLSLKEALMKTPVLALPIFSDPFTIQTDASRVGTGSVLSQRGHPLAYFSKQMSSRLQSSSAYVREMFAITEAIKKWRQYLLGRKFTIETDHQSLRAMIHQTIQTPEQQKWVTKLLGFDFEIIYKPGKENAPADALSRISSSAFHALQATSKPISALLAALRQFLQTHQPSKDLITSITSSPGDYSDYIIKDGLIFFKDRIWIPPDSALQPLILHEFHASPVGGHAGVQRTLSRIASTFFWPQMRQHVKDFVSTCQTCQQIKPFNKAPPGLLQPLPIPGKIWDSISMDFITNLPPSYAKTTILVIVDRLSKHAHFCAIGSHFSAPQLADIFVKEITRLHGFPSSIISDRNPLFMSSFWRELFKLQGTVLSMSSSYHPQTDGQTEVLNRCLEDYLQSFIADNPSSWVKYLPWAEWCYNTAWHSSIRMTLFEAVYKRPPPSLVDYIEGSAIVASVEEFLASRTQLLDRLQANLQRAQGRIRNQANKQRTYV